MPLLPHALVSLEDLRVYLDEQGEGQAANKENAINRATSWLEGETRREFVSRGDRTEYHTVESPRATIQLQHWPIVSVTSVHESTDSPRAYDAGALLTADTDYQVSAEAGQIRRLEDSELTAWPRGYRAIQVVYDSGYQDVDGSPVGAATVPPDLALLCLTVAAGIYKESDRSRWGISSVTDSQGSITRFLGYLPPDMKRHLNFYSRTMEVGRTWEAA